MPATNIPVQTPARAGTVLPAATAADTVNGNDFLNSGKTLFTVFNGGGSPYNLTIKVTGQVDGLTPADRVVAIPASATVLFGPFPVDSYSNRVTITGANAALTFRIFEPTTL